MIIKKILLFRKLNFRFSESDQNNKFYLNILFRRKAFIVEMFSHLSSDGQNTLMIRDRP